MFPKFPSFEHRASPGERRFLERTAVTGRDLLTGPGFLGGNLSLLGGKPRLRNRRPTSHKRLVVVVAEVRPAKLRPSFGS